MKEKVVNFFKSEKLDFIVRYPTIFLFYIPVVFLVLATTIQLESYDITFRFGNCVLFSYTYKMPLDILFEILGALSLVISLSISAVRMTIYKNNLEKRIEIYSHWKNSALIGMVLLAVLFFNTACYNGTWNKLNFDYSIMSYLAGLYILMIILFFIKSRGLDNSDLF